VSTSVTLIVTPRAAIDPDRYTGEVPPDISAVLRASGQPEEPGLWCPGSGPARLLFQLSGPDRLTAGQRMVDDLRLLGYAAELSISR
jgi:hypothetical protein